MKIINPATETLLKEIPEDTPKNLESRFHEAVAAQKLWRATSLSSRTQCIRRFQELLKLNAERLVRLLTEEMGKPISQSQGEVKATAERIDYFIQETPHAIAEQVVWNLPEQGLVEAITHEPLGVIANISAWNYPLFVGTNVFIPALLTGNAVLYKPSEFATLTGIALGELLQEAGVPQGVFQTVIGSGSVGSALLELPINGVFFTGSFPTGQKIAQVASTKMIKIQLELGGKDPAYICEDVQYEQVAAAVADGAFYNNGQSCCAVERIYVRSEIYEDFVRAFTKTVQGFSLGDPLQEGTYLGPLTRRAQQEVLERQIRDALSKGAKLLCGGKRTSVLGKGYYFEPTVLADVNHTMEVMHEESFGPVIGIQSVSSDAEAMRLMQDTDYGLTSSVYTKSEDRAHAILEEMNSGTVYWNCCDRVSPRLPWSGRKHSGIGSTLSTLGIQAFTQPKAWHRKRAT